VDLQRLQVTSASAAIVLKLMMVCNDMQLANEALADWKKEQPRNRKCRQVGARMYFVRLQLSHLHEAITIPKTLQKDESLRRLIDKCDQRTRESCHKFESFLHDASRPLHTILAAIRSNLVFHYDERGKMIMKTLSDRAQLCGRFSSITRGDSAYLWHFKVADDIVDEIVVRQIFKVARNQELRIEVERITDEIHELFLYFVDFAGELLWRYCEQS
jgi:hypothetical protein